MNMSHPTLSSEKSIDGSMTEQLTTSENGEMVSKKFHEVP